MANENYDELDINTHPKEFKNHCEKKKDLMTELKNFPDNQTLSDIVKAIYEQLSNEIQNSDIA